MAKVRPASKPTISNIWRGYDIKPHAVNPIKLSRDPRLPEQTLAPTRPKSL